MLHAAASFSVYVSMWFSTDPWNTFPSMSLPFRVVYVSLFADGKMTT